MNNRFYAVDTADGIFNVITHSAFHTGQDWTIYPNPASNYFFLKTSTPEVQQEILISELSGREIIRLYTSTSQPIDISGFNPGLYLVTSGEGTKKLVVK